MERYRFVDYYDFYIDTVVKLLMENEPPIYDLVDLPNVSQSTPIETRDAGDKKYIKNKWCVHGQIPKPVQKIVRPEMLSFIEDSVWDRKALTYTTKVIPFFLKNLIDVGHKVEFKDAGDGRTQRIISGYFELKIPLIGHIFDKAVIVHVKKNAEDDFKLSNNALIQYITKNGDPNRDKSKLKF